MLLFGYIVAQTPEPVEVVADTTTMGGREMVELTKLFGDISTDIIVLEARLEKVNFAFNRAYFMQQKELAKREEKEKDKKKKKK